MDGDSPALCCEFEGDRPADPACGTGDESDPRCLGGCRRDLGLSHARELLGQLRHCGRLARTIDHDRPSTRPPNLLENSPKTWSDVAEKRGNPDGLWQLNHTRRYKPAPTAIIALEFSRIPALTALSGRSDSRAPK